MGSVEKIDSRKGYGTVYEGKKKNRGGRKKKKEGGEGEQSCALGAVNFDE